MIRLFLVGLRFPSRLPGRMLSNSLLPQILCSFTIGESLFDLHWAAICMVVRPLQRKISYSLEERAWRLWNLNKRTHTVKSRLMYPGWKPRAPQAEDPWMTEVRTQKGPVRWLAKHFSARRRLLLLKQRRNSNQISFFKNESLDQSNSLRK